MVTGHKGDSLTNGIVPIMYMNGMSATPRSERDIMIQVGIAEIRDNLAEALNKVAYAGERVILARRGKGVAALVSMEDLELLEKLEDESDIKAARKARKEKGSVPLAEIKGQNGSRLPLSS